MKVETLPRGNSLLGSSGPYFIGLRDVFARLEVELIDRIAETIWRGYEQGRTLFLFGNGGSAALASHFACDLAKGTSTGKSRRMRAIALTDNISLLTAWANDSHYDEIFAEQLQNLVQPGDLVLAVSGSGNSRNVIRGLEVAREAGATLMALTGFDGGLVKELCDLCLVVPSDNMQYIEDAHLGISHAIFCVIRDRMMAEKEIETKTNLPTAEAGVLRAVIFDMDGVIADSHPIHLQAWKCLLAEQGMDVSSIDLEFLYAGRSRKEILRYYLGALGDREVEVLGRRKDELYRHVAAEINLRAKPGLFNVLDELDAAGIPFALATTGGRQRTTETLSHFGIAGRFGAVVTGEDVKASKPAPDLFLSAASRLAVEPQNALVIEDSVAGVQAARAAGMKCLGFAPADKVASLSAAGANEVITEFPPAPLELFQRLFTLNSSERKTRAGQAHGGRAEVGAKECNPSC